MIKTIIDSDIDEIRKLIAVCVRESVVSSSDHAELLLNDIDAILDDWLVSKEKWCHLKYVLDKKIAGVVFIKDFWNLDLMFVLPSHYKRGIGKSLFASAIAVCKDKPDITKIKLNSSTHAAGFYESMGCVRSGDARDLPGGCIPYEYEL